MQPLLSVYVPTYNRCELLRNQLGSIRSALAAVDAARCEVVVSDNCSNDATDEFLRTQPWIVHYRNEENLGGVNNVIQAARRTSGRYVWILGDDDLVVRDSIGCLMKHLDSHGDVEVFLVSHALASFTDYQNLVNNIADVEADTSYLNLFDRELEDGRIPSLKEALKEAKFSSPFNFISNLVYRRDVWEATLPECEESNLRYEDQTDVVSSFPHTFILYKYLRDSSFFVVRKPLVLGFIGEQDFLSKWPVLQFVYYPELFQFPVNSAKYRKVVARQKALILSGYNDLEAVFDHCGFSTMLHVSKTSWLWREQPRYWSLLSGWAIKQGYSKFLKILFYATLGSVAWPMMKPSYNNSRKRIAPLG